MKFLITMILLVGVLAGSAAGDEAADHFEAKVRPVLAGKCFRCHSVGRKAGLRLDSREALLKGGKSGPVVVPGDPAKSLLIQAVTHQHEKIKMPPNGRLPDRVVADLIRWVADGAVWPAAPKGTRVEFEISEKQRRFWSFQLLEKPDVPDVSADEWRRNPVDAFIFAGLESKTLTPGTLADKRTLIRRATFDLIGLPPTPEEVEAFVADESPQAFAKVVERLLASRHYGERWGRHWLDLVRYADTAGDAADFPIPEAYKYRNYVIDAFNSDKPYDDFVREQIAGDLLPSENDDDRWQHVIATGYIAISRRIGVSPQNLRHITIEDTIGNLGKTFLGLSLGCARCHEHKFDPIPTEDYYALYGIFDSSVYPHVGAEHKPHRQDFVYRIGNEKSDETLKPYRDELEIWNVKERAQLEVYRAFQKRKITDPNFTRESTWNDLLRVRAERAVVAKTFPNLEIAYAIQEGQSHDVHVMKAGDPKSRGTLVRRGFLQILGGATLPGAAQGSGRRELADWIADPKNPLTARVMANRIWHYHFGKGLVKSTSDFGVRGTPPTHPALLDFLAAYFIEQGWSIKRMHRLIMLSRTYQLASSDVPKNSAIDPQNDMLWRANRRRLDSEQIRDTLLTFSGQLDRTPGGRQPFDHRLTYFYRQHEPFAETFPSNRRTVYLMQQRIQKNPYLDLFDGPDGNLHFGERKSSTTTLQALFLMNSEFVHRQAEAMAGRLLTAADDTAGRVDWAYGTVFSRPANGAEIARAERFLDTIALQLPKSVGDEKSSQQSAWAGYLRAMLSSNEFMFVD